MDSGLRDTLRRYHLLYLEDDVTVFTPLLPVLTELFAKVSHADNVQEAWKLYREEIPDILLIDIKMREGKSGLDMIEEIRTTDKETPIIIATAYSDFPLLKRAIPLRLIDYLVKPFSFKQLLETFSKALQLDEKKQVKPIFFPDGTRYDPIGKKILDADGKTLEVHLKELKLLELLLESPTRVFSKSEIFDRVWEETTISDITLRTLVKRLKGKIGKQAIRNVTGYGYQIVLKE